MCVLILALYNTVHIDTGTTVRTEVNKTNSTKYNIHYSRRFHVGKSLDEDVFPLLLNQTTFV
jgi:hypothetical protein